MSAKQQPASRILVQDRATSRFLKIPADWTDSPAEAFNFQSSVIAHEFCRAGRLENVQMVLQLGDSLRELIGPA